MPAWCRLTGDETWFFSAVTQPVAVTLAVRDVQQDSYKVLGYPPVVLNTPLDVTKGAIQDQLALYFGEDVRCVGLA